MSTDTTTPPAAGTHACTTCRDTHPGTHGTAPADRTSVPGHAARAEVPPNVTFLPPRPAHATTDAAARVPHAERLWTPAEAAAFLGMSESWVYTASRTGAVPAVRLGRAVRFDPATLRAWVRGERVGKAVQLPTCR